MPLPAVRLSSRDTRYCFRRESGVSTRAQLAGATVNILKPQRSDLPDPQPQP